MSDTPNLPRTRRARRRLTLLCSLLSFLSVTADTHAGEWWDGFGPSGVEGAVYSMTEHLGDLYVGGLFDAAGGQPATNIARFNGRHWSAVDTGTDGRVRTVYSWGGSLVIGGNFFTAGGLDCAHVAILDLGEWTPMGEGLPDWPNAFCVHNAALHACGKIDADGDWNYSVIARWDGKNWHDEFDGTSLINEAHDLIHFDGSLFYGGDFEYDAFDPSIFNFTEWTGTDWTDFGFGSGQHVNTLLVHDNGLYIGGSFSVAGAIPSCGLVYMTGGRTLNPVAQPDVPRTVVDLTIWNQGLVVGQENAVIPYTGIAWLDTLGGALDGDLNCLATLGIDLYAAGSFAGGIARWDREWDEWVQVGGSPGTVNHERNTIRALCQYDGHIVAAGELIVPTVLAAETHCFNIGIWDGEAWHRMDSGLNATAYDVVVFEGDLIAGGHFDRAGGAVAAHIARWDGADWQDIGGADGDVNALVVWNGQLAAGGSFRHAGSVSAERIARWDGGQWHALGMGLNGTVQALAVLDGDLYAGGSFTTAGGVSANNVARWDGSQWRPLGSGVGAIVYALCPHDGDLIAGGYFSEAGGEPASHIARWDGSQWHPLGAGVSGPVSAYYVTSLLSASGDLFVGGEFTEAGGTPASGIAVWDGATWNDFAGGVHDGFWQTIVYDMLVKDGDLYLGGDFGAVGTQGQVSVNIARWVDGSLTPVFLQEFEVVAAAGAVTATWRTTGPSGVPDFELTAEANGEVRTVPHQAAADGCFQAVDRPGGTAAVTRVTYTLWHRQLGREAELLARRTITLGIPSAVRLVGASPNPFNPVTTVIFELDHAQSVWLGVYDLSGRMVAQLTEGVFPAGRHEVRWPGTDRFGAPIGSGTYIVRLKAAGETESCKLAILR